MSNDKNLSLMSHLLELRTRLVRVVIAVLLTTGISFFFAKNIFEILKEPAAGTPFIFTEITGMVSIYMKVCLTSGIILAMPYIIYHLIMFVSPALTPREKRYVYSTVPFIALMFLGGVAFGYFVLVPPAMHFLVTFGSDLATPMIKIDNYISLVGRILLAIGIIFEMPVVTTLLARLGIITSQWMAHKRKIAIIVAFIAGAIITPTFDPVNQILVAVPLIILYELSIWLAKLVEKNRLTEATSSTT